MQPPILSLWTLCETKTASLAVVHVYILHLARFTLWYLLIIITWVQTSITQLRFYLSETPVGTSLLLVQNHDELCEVILEEYSVHH